MTTIIIMTVIGLACLLALKIYEKKYREPESISLKIEPAPKGPASISQPPRYKVADSLITPGEKEFYSVLRKAIPEAAIHPKVRVGDVLKHTTGKIGDFWRISQFHFDWVICHPDTCEPLAAIELDDSSHRRARNKKNDATKNLAAEEAGFAIVRFTTASRYDENFIREKIASVINQIADRKDRKTNLRNT